MEKESLDTRVNAAYHAQDANHSGTFRAKRPCRNRMFAHQGPPAERGTERIDRNAIFFMVRFSSHEPNCDKVAKRGDAEEKKPTMGSDESFGRKIRAVVASSEMGR